MMVFDRDGNFLSSWGEGQWPRAHGIHMGPDDQPLHDRRRRPLRAQMHRSRGKVLFEMGIPGKPAPYMSGEPFHRCTHTALSPKGEIYVSDGYGNARVHKYSPDGKLLLSWGEPGTDPGQFNIVHNICTDADGWVYVADRENHRVQVFDGNGKYETQWNNLHRPCGLYMPYTHHPVCYIGELGPAHGGKPQTQSRTAGQHRRSPGQAVGADRRSACRGWGRPSFSARTAWPSICAATSMSAKSAGHCGRDSSRTSRVRSRSAPCGSSRRCAEPHRSLRRLTFAP